MSVAASVALVAPTIAASPPASADVSDTYRQRSGVQPWSPDAALLEVGQYADPVWDPADTRPFRWALLWYEFRSRTELGGASRAFEAFARTDLRLVEYTAGNTFHDFPSAAGFYVDTSLSDPDDGTASVGWGLEDADFIQEQTVYQVELETVTWQSVNTPPNQPTDEYGVEWGFNAAYRHPSGSTLVDAACLEVPVLYNPAYCVFDDYALDAVRDHDFVVARNASHSYNWKRNWLSNGDFESDGVGDMSTWGRWWYEGTDMPDTRCDNELSVTFGYFSNCELALSGGAGAWGWVDRTVEEGRSLTLEAMFRCESLSTPCPAALSYGVSGSYISNIFVVPAEDKWYRCRVDFAHYSSTHNELQVGGSTITVGVDSLSLPDPGVRLLVDYVMLTDHNDVISATGYDPGPPEEGESCTAYDEYITQ